MDLLSPELPGNLNELKKRAVRAWWDDGLYDLAISLLMVIMAFWANHLILRTNFLPSAWPWPFSQVADTDLSPRMVLAWIFAGALFIAGYLFVAFRVVTYLKRILIAPIRGEIRHSFWLPVERSVLIWYIVGYIMGSAILITLNSSFLGGPRFTSAYLSVGFCMINLVIGREYALSRNVAMGLVGLLLTIAMEWFLTASANPLTGPQNWFEASSLHGNVWMNLLIWAALYAFNGVISFVQVRKEAPHGAER